MKSSPWASGSTTSLPPWQRLLDRIDCLLHGGPDAECRQSLRIHISILAIILTLAFFRKALVMIGVRQPSPSQRPRLRSRARIHDILCYPIKSCGAVSLAKARIGAKGLELDRRWMVVRRARGNNVGLGEWEKMSLREESRLTLIQPTIEEDGLLLSLSPEAKLFRPLPPIKIPLHTTRSTALDILPSIPMYDDHATGLVIPFHPTFTTSYTGTPSEWLSTFLGYEVKLVQFDAQAERTRRHFPIYKRPHMAGDEERRRMGVEAQPIEWQDEYPLMVCSVESLLSLQSRIHAAAHSTDGTDGLGGAAFSEKMFKAEMWKERSSSSSNGGEGGQDWLDVRRFRPNIVLARVGDDDDDDDDEVGVRGGKKGGGGEGEGRGSSIRAWEEDQWTRIDFTTTITTPSPSPPPHLHVTARCERCLLTTVDPSTSDNTSPAVPLGFLRRDERSHLVKKLEKGRKGPCFGVYAIPGGREEEGVNGEKGEEEGFEVWKGMEVTCWWRREGEE